VHPKVFHCSPFCGFLQLDAWSKSDAQSSVYRFAFRESSTLTGRVAQNWAADGLSQPVPR
jgi:hypothetical protein